MTPAQAAKLLTLAAAFDQRTIGIEDARAWALALNDLDPARCTEAIIAHYRTETARVMPAHIRRWLNSPEARAAKVARWRERHGIAAVLDSDTEETYAERATARRLEAIEGGELA